MRTRFRDVDLADYEQIFGAQEVNKRNEGTERRTPATRCAVPVVDEMQRQKGTASAEHLKFALGVIDAPRFSAKEG